jgi:hypothetical protein
VDRYKLETASFDRFELTMTQEQAESCVPRGGDALPYVKALAAKDRRLNAQLDEVGPEDIRDQLEEYGCWDDDELKDDEANRYRIVWIAAGDIWDNVREREKEVKHA